MYINNERREIDSIDDERLPLHVFKEQYHDHLVELYKLFLQQNPQHEDTGDLFESYSDTEHKIYLSNPSNYP